MNLKKILKERKISLVKLSKATGISTNALSSFQNQKTESVYYPTIEAITKELDISVGELIEQIDEYYEMKVELKKYILERHSCTAIVHFIGVEHDAKYTHNIDFKYHYSNIPFGNSKCLNIYLENGLDKDLPKFIEKIINQYDLTEHGKGLFYCIGYLLLQELMKLSDFPKLNLNDIVLLYTDDVTCPRYKVENTPKAISRNTGEAMEYTFREVINSLYLVTADRSIELISNHLPKDIQYAPYIESLSTLGFVSKVEVEQCGYERKLFIH